MSHRRVLQHIDSLKQPLMCSLDATGLSLHILHRMGHKRKPSHAQTINRQLGQRCCSAAFDSGPSGFPSTHMVLSCDHSSPGTAVNAKTPWWVTPHSPRSSLVSSGQWRAHATSAFAPLSPRWVLHSLNSRNSAKCAAAAGSPCTNSNRKELPVTSNPKP